jgi:membrane protease YdiL (CAAX protease family)
MNVQSVIGNFGSTTKRTSGRFANSLQRLAQRLGRLIALIVRSLKPGTVKTYRFLKPVVRAGWPMALIILLVGAAQLTLLWRPVVGIYFNAAALAVLVGLALWSEKLRQLAISVAIIPVATMVILSLPQTSVFAETVVFYDALLILALIYRFMFTIEYPLAETRLGLKAYALAIPLMLVIGQALGVLGYFMLRTHYTFGNTSLPLVGATVVVFALAEETLFHGLIQQRASRVMHPILAAILSTFLFVLMSIDSTTIIAPLFALILGAVLSFTYYKKQNLVLTMAINAMCKLAYVGLLATFVFR